VLLIGRALQLERGGMGMLVTPQTKTETNRPNSRKPNLTIRTMLHAPAATMTAAFSARLPLG